MPSKISKTWTIKMTSKHSDTEHEQLDKYTNDRQIIDLQKSKWKTLTMGILQIIQKVNSEKIAHC